MSQKTSADGPADRHRGLDYWLLGCLASVVSLTSLLHYYRWGQILLSGDAVAHINIARRVFDSRTPGPLQLGTVWLPLQHVITAPFLFSDWAWSSGIGGSVPSMAAYVMATLGMYRLVVGGIRSIGGSGGVARISGWLAALILGANPNLIYIQATALNEPLSLALFIWALVYMSDFANSLEGGASRDDSRPLRRCGWLLAAGMMVRYDAWFAAVLFVLTALHVTARAKRLAKERQTPSRLKSLSRFVLVCAAAPALWFAYNAFVWGNPIEFATGPYSARAIEERSRRPGDPHYPGWHSPYVAAEHLLRNATLTVGETRTEKLARTSGWEKPWLPVALIGTALAFGAARRLTPWMLLWVPLPFYTLSIAWGSVPIFVPQWWPFSYYNTRYGLQLLPALAAFAALAAYFLLTAVRRLRLRIAVIAIMLAFVAGSYASVWRNVPLCLREIRANGGARYALDRRLAAELEKLPASATLLMYVGDHGGALQDARIPLRRTINEGNNQLWKRALAAPGAHADFVIAGTTDPVARAIREHPERLMVAAIVQAAGQPPVTVYRVVR